LKKRRELLAQLIPVNRMVREPNCVGGLLISSVDQTRTTGFCPSIPASAAICLPSGLIVAPHIFRYRDIAATGNAGVVGRQLWMGVALAGALAVVGAVSAIAAADVSEIHEAAANRNLCKRMII
jgi:hypothetical protein